MLWIADWVICVGCHADPMVVIRDSIACVAAVLSALEKSDVMALQQSSTFRAATDTLPVAVLQRSVLEFAHRFLDPILRQSLLYAGEPVPGPAAVAALRQGMRQFVHMYVCMYVCICMYV
jgi:hypothetical protein